MTDARKSFPSQDEDSYSQRTQFDSILQNQRHVELLGAVKKLTSSIILLQRSHDELRAHVDRQFESVHQHIDQLNFISSARRRAENSPPKSDDTERETMTVDDYLLRRKRQRIQTYDGSSSEGLPHVVKNTNSWMCGGKERVQSCLSFFDDIFREDHDVHDAVPSRLQEIRNSSSNSSNSNSSSNSTSRTRNSSAIKWGSGRGQYNATSLVTCESALEYIGDSSSNGSYSAMTDEFSLH